MSGGMDFQRRTWNDPRRRCPKCGKRATIVIFRLEAEEGTVEDVWLHCSRCNYNFQNSLCEEKED